MAQTTTFLALPDDLPGRDELIHHLTQAGGTVISEESILQQMEGHYRGIFENAPISIWEEDFSQVKQMLDDLHSQGIVDFIAYCTEHSEFVINAIAAVKILNVNQTGIRFYGAKDRADLTNGLSRIMYDASHDVFIHEMLAIWNKQTEFNYDGINYDINGKILPVNVRWSVFPGCEETYRRVLVTILDISDQQATRQALSLSEERYQVISEITTDFAFSLIMSQDGHFQLEWVTDTFLQSTGYSIQELTKGGSMDFITHPDDRPRLREATHRLMSGQTVTFEMRLLTKSGQVRWVRSITRTSPINPHNTGIRIIGAVQDITDRVEAEQALTETKHQLELRVQELEKRTQEIGLLTDMANNLQLCRTMKEAYGIAAETASNLFPTFSGAFYIQNPGKKNLTQESFWGTSPYHQEMEFSDCWALRRGTPFLVQDEPRNLVCSHARPVSEFQASLCTPILQQGEVFGLFHLETFTSQPAIDPSTIRLANALTEQIGLALTNLRLRENLSEQALHDPLSGLYNRYYMEEYLDKELHRSRRSGRPVSIIMIDMDHFRDLNALFGHPNVDQALAEVGKFILRSIRAGDVACRYGGDEFLLILPETALEAAQERANQLCAAVHSVQVHSEHRPPQPVTFSVGVASFPQHGRTISDLLRAADSAVFSAKDHGRDRVEVAAP